MASPHRSSQAVRKPERPAWMALAIFLITVLVFWRATANGFVNYDDPDYVTANEHVKAGLTVDGIKWALTAGHAANWHPLTWGSHMLDVSFFGMSPEGHHATSVVIHSLNAVLAFLAFRQLTARFWLSAVIAVVFAIHPLRVESVAWVSERKDVLSGAFFFGLLWMYGIYAGHRQSGRSAAGAYVGALVLFALGLAAKPMLVTVPCVLLLLDVWPLGRVELTRQGVLGSRSVLIEKLPFFVLSVGSCVITYFAQRSGGAMTGALQLDARLANALVGVVRYVGLFFWPANLAALYPHPGFWPAATVLAAAAFLVFVTVSAWIVRRESPWLLVGWLWFLGMLVPVSGVVQVGLQSIADRYSYLPHLGLEFVVVIAAAGLLRAANRALIACIALGLLAMMTLTVRQLRYWHDSLTLFDHTIAVAGKGNYLAYNNRGVALFHDGNIVDAIEAYRQSLAINPGYAEANNNLGEALAREGRLAEAIQYYRKALQLDPRLVEPHNNLANVLVDQGAMEEAMQHYRYALEQRPHDPNMLNNYGAALAMSGKLDESIAQIEKALQYAPDYASAHANLGNILAMRGRKEDALAHYRRALALEPLDARTFYNQGNVLTELGRISEAIESYQRALQLSPVNPEAHAMLGVAFARAGRREDALRELRTALQQRPDYAQARAWLEAVEKANP